MVNLMCCGCVVALGESTQVEGEEVSVGCNCRPLSGRISTKTLTYLFTFNRIENYEPVAWYRFPPGLPKSPNPTAKAT